MAYIQKPGRGNSPKTGSGLPSAFKQIDPKQGEKPEVATKASEKIHKELNANPVEKGKEFQTTYSPKGGFKGKETNIENIASGDYIHRVQGGKTVASVKKDTREAKNFIQETEKQIADQNFRRDKMAHYLNDRKASANVNYNK